MSSYAVLGITPDATNDEVRLAYKHKVSLTLASSGPRVHRVC